MSRLIDADKCPCILCKDTRNAHCTYEHRSCEKFCNWLNNIIYDEEKVVAELKTLPNREADYYYTSSNDVIDREDAIDIVKRGGVE